MALIDRTGAEALMPEEYARDIVQGVPKASAALALSRKLPNMSRIQRRIPVLSSLPTAYWLTGDTDQKKTTNVAWANKYLDAEELAVIVPIPEAVLDDADYDIWGEVKPRIMEAFGIAIDGAIFFGTNKPTSWPECLVYQAQRSGNVVVLGTGSDIADDVGAAAGVMSTIEADGFEVNGFAAAVGMKAQFRGLRETGGALIFQPSMQAGTPASLYGQPIHYVNNGAWDETAATGPEVAGEEGGAHIIMGDFNQSVYAMRQDMTYKVLSEATIYDTDGTTILYRLAQQDMVALRCVMRLAWQVPNPINRMNETEWTTGVAGAFRYPFGALVPAAV